MNVVLFVVILIVSFIVVRIGAVAFELTGLEWSVAKFQSLSCFTGTGFTTKESELVTRNPQRRKIASVLMVFGHAGLVTLVATFVNTIRTDSAILFWDHEYLVGHIPPQVIPWINIAIIVFSFYVINKFFSNARLATILTETLRKQIVKKDIIKYVTCEELMISTGGYGVTRMHVREGSVFAGKNLHESGLRNQGVTVLSIERQGETIPNPVARERIEVGDMLICFGKVDTMSAQFYVAEAQ